MAVYNGEKYVRLAIDSVLSQDFANIELIVVDDCSTDATPAIVHSYDDPRIVYIRNAENMRQTRSLNVALSRARAELVARIDADDVFLPGKLRRQYEFMTAHPDVAVCGTGAMRIDADGTETGVNLLPSDPVDIRFRALRTVPVCHVSVMMRRAAVLACGGYPEQYQFAADFALWSQMLRQSYVITNLADVLVQYREFGETFGAAQKVGAAGTESAEIIRANIHALAGLDLSPEECRGIALLYFPASGASVSDLCAAFLNLRRLARRVYGRPPRRAARALAGVLVWSVTKRLAYLRAQRPAVAVAPHVLAAVRRFARHPEVVAVVLAASAAAVMGERRLVKLKEFMMLRTARTRT
jgi:hypothetical protein